MIMPPRWGRHMQLHQSVARYTWDGEEAPGMIERSTPPGGMTWTAGRDEPLDIATPRNRSRRLRVPDSGASTCSCMHSNARHGSPSWVEVRSPR
ncbi:MAG: hypothetical protein R2695_19900 [Acidimicrobiales bacterium]